ncbi:MAG: glycosyltransferase family 4 protein [Planctomycetales bacterium]|nr:glycosyltransferase family 4 protein [Planctomycetales bacterium]
MIISGGFSGAAKYAVNQSLWLHERGHQVTTVCMPDTWPEKELIRRGIKPWSSSLSSWGPSEFRRMAKLIAEEKIDLVHTHNTRAHVFGAILRSWVRLPVVATAHHRHFHFHWPMNDLVIANSEATKRFHRRAHLLSARKLQLLYCPIDTETFDRVNQLEIDKTRARWDLTPDDLSIAIVGNVIVRKGHDILISAMPRILHRFPSTKLVVVGPKQTKFALHCQAMARKLGVDHALRWVGFETNMAQAMHAIDVCICSSREESFGLTAAEAHAAGKPVVASRVGGLTEIVGHETTGIVVSPKSAEQLADAVIRLLADTQLRHDLGQQGREHVQRLFRIDKHIDELESIYGNLLNHLPNG